MRNRRGLFDADVWIWPTI